MKFYKFTGVAAFCFFQAANYLGTHCDLAGKLALTGVSLAFITFFSSMGDWT